MKPIHLIPALTLAVAIGLSGLAAAEPGQTAPGVTAQYNPKELQVDNIQSPRDPASGQDSPALKTEWITSARTETAIVTPQSTQPPQPAPGTAAQYNPKEIGIDKIQSPRDPASGQSGNAQTTDGFKSVGGLSSETEFIGKNAGTGDPASGQGSGVTPQGMVFTNDTIDKVDAGQPTANTVREGGVNDTTHRTKKPRRNRDGTRGRRMHKP
jgi:hypothetical protein